SEFADRYMSEHALVHKKPRSAEEDRRNLAIHIRSALGAKRLRDITQDDIKRFHVALRNTSATANRCLALVSHIFTMARDAGLIVGTNPCKGIKRFRERKRNRFLSEAELARIAEAMEQHRGDLSEAIPAAVRLLLFTGARLSEVLTLRWNYIDQEHGII